MYVTGTFDDWQKTEQLEKVGDHFEKDVVLADASKKIYYKVRRAPSAFAGSFSCRLDSFEPFPSRFYPCKRIALFVERPASHSGAVVVFVDRVLSKVIAMDVVQSASLPWCGSHRLASQYIELHVAEAELASVPAERFVIYNSCICEMFKPIAMSTRAACRVAANIGSRQGTVSPSVSAPTSRVVPALLEQSEAESA